jgi:putative phosphoesterase
MKYIIAADLHGSWYYCEQLIKRFHDEEADKLLLLGDILYHGPRNELPKDYNPKKVFPALNELKEQIICVRGNCDSEVDQMVLEFPIMADYAIVESDGITLFATHGHLYNQDNPPPFKRGSILLNGHFHQPICEVLEDFTYINPGSLSLPKEGNAHSYIAFQGGEFLWKDVCDGREFKRYSATST